MLHITCEELKSCYKHKLVVLLLCVALFTVSLLPEVLLCMEGLFVNSFGVSQLGEFCKGWGVQCVSAKDTWRCPSNVYCPRLLAAAFIVFFPYPCFYCSVFPDSS